MDGQSAPGPEQNEKPFDSRVIFSSQRQGQFEKINVSSSQGRT